MLITIKNKTYQKPLSWISLLTIVVLFTSQKEPAFAQVNADSTLPKNSQVIQQGNIYNITGGTQAGSNLFHSFEKFGVPTGGEAYFNNAVDIQNIISRVTGKSISNINGLIRANGTANLFLINPNGIVFGENAKLDIGGSFIGTTADSIKFGDNIEFSATNPENTPLLTVNVPLGLQYGKNPGKIEIKGKGEPERSTPEVFESTSGLQVPASKTLAILGGDVYLVGATLKASGGRIELGSVREEGLVSITPLEIGFAFGFEKLENLGEIRLSQNTAVDATGNGAGDVRVTGKNLTITDNSVITSTQTGTETGAGILINATDSVNLNGINDTFVPSGLYANNVSGDATEETGNITINTQQLRVQNGATVTTNVWSAGKGGNINIKANNLTIESGAKVNANTYSTGNGGNLNINAEDVQVIGKDNNNLSQLSALVRQDSTGYSGDVNITTDDLLVGGEAFVDASTRGKGDGGNLTINAGSKVELIGKDGGLFVTAEKPSTGDSGSLIINTKRMVVKNGAFVSASNNSQGNAGNLKITTNDLSLQNNARFFSGRISEDKEVGELTIKTNNLLVTGGSQVKAGTSSQGGNLKIDAQEVQVIGTGNNGNTPSSLTVSIQKDSTENGGNLTINTNTLLIKDGAFLSTGTSGKGNGGNLNINAEDVQVIGFGGNNPDNNNQPYFSGLFATAEQPSIGNAGKLTINTTDMLVADGAFVSTSTNSKGNGGDLTINSNSLQIGNDSKVISETKTGGIGGNLKITTNNLLIENGGKVSSGTSGAGNGGDLTINSDTIKVKDDRAQITVESTGTGNAGIITLNTRSISLDNKALLNASTQSVDSNNEQATINIINARDLILRRGSNILTNAKGENVRGGNININSDVIAALENSDISANSENFRGGNIKIKAQGIFGTQFRALPTPNSDITATGASLDLSGTVEIIIPENNSSDDLVELPTIPVDMKLAQGCYSRGYAQNQFLIVGRGGLLPLPEDFLTPSAVRVDWVNLQPKIENSFSHRDNLVKTTIEKPKGIVEATGWILNDKGEIIFTDNPSVATADNSMEQTAECE